jgi:hypothetical protein
MPPLGNGVMDEADLGAAGAELNPTRQMYRELAWNSFSPGRTAAGATLAGRDSSIAARDANRRFGASPDNGCPLGQARVAAVPGPFMIKD